MVSLPCSAAGTAAAAAVGTAAAAIFATGMVISLEIVRTKEVGKVEAVHGVPRLLPARAPPPVVASLVQMDIRTVPGPARNPARGGGAAGVEGGA